MNAYKNPLFLGVEGTHGFSFDPAVRHSFFKKVLFISVEILYEKLY